VGFCIRTTDLYLLQSNPELRGVSISASLFPTQPRHQLCTRMSAIFSDKGRTVQRALNLEHIDESARNATAVEQMLGRLSNDEREGTRHAEH